MTTQGLSIRAPRVDEAELLADLHLRTWQETYVDHFPSSAWGPEARASRLQLWRAICTTPRPDSRTAVADFGGRVLGFAHVGRNLDDPPPRERQLWFIYLLGSAQGSGAGQELLDDVLGGEPASLWVLEANARARAFYVRNGFLPDGARQPTGFDGGGVEIRMVR